MFPVSIEACGQKAVGEIKPHRAKKHLFTMYAYILATILVQLTLLYGLCWGPTRSWKLWSKTWCTVKQDNELKGNLCGESCDKTCCESCSESCSESCDKTCNESCCEPTTIIHRQQPRAPSPIMDLDVVD